MKNLEEQELEKFIRDNKEKFDVYQPEPDHDQQHKKTSGQATAFKTGTFFGQFFKGRFNNFDVINDVATHI